MHYVIEKAKNLGIFDDIKNSFPDIGNISISNRNNIKSSNKINMVHIKPVIMANNKNNNNNNNPKKRPATGNLIFGRHANKLNNIKFNNLKVGGKKKNEDIGFINVHNNNKKKVFIPKKVKINSSKDKNKSKSSNKIEVRKKVMISQKKKDYFLEEVKKFEKKSNINKEINNNNNDNYPFLIFNNGNQNNWINTKELNNICKDTSITKEENNINYSNNNINNNVELKNGYNIDSNFNKENDIINNNKSNNNNHNKEININSINLNFDKTKEKNENDNNFSIESDIYMTAKKELYQP